MVKRIIAIDIGNTAGTVGFYEGGRLKDFRSIGYNAIPKYVKKIAKSGSNIQCHVIISSVVPKITSFLKSSISRIKWVNIWIAGDNLTLKIAHKYKNYNKLGIDRKVNAYGAIRIYRLPMLVIDFGTATTYDYIDPKGVFRGGLIIPGPTLSYQALLAKGALLPKGRKLPKRARSFPGRDTVSCLEAGILEGYGAMTDGLIRRFKEKFGPKLRVLATGGLAKTIAPYARGIDILDPQHSIKSLLALWRDQMGKKSA